ncbi:MAG: hypothetical protein F4Y27_02805 [Acidimicrobiaceae bacterium]|nr:hypothetical protein [Acidimicrobiaceae bacterium]MXW61196.1 hypothetical protein [Acidimicrobiaceae bacterium]MYA73595.1 hypothetical protein [Acidimicrobiaceae bacterium]MYC41530.1 hypothetical protein [Acidimicrobiaceae bacterium]MYG56240.1 hypothetical protein [Acidimicrobiaceae bacterium]
MDDHNKPGFFATHFDSPSKILKRPMRDHLIYVAIHCVILAVAINTSDAVSWLMLGASLAGFAVLVLQHWRNMKTPQKATSDRSSSSLKPAKPN